MLLLMVAGCGPAYIPRPKLPGQALPAPAVERVLTQLRERAGAVRSWRGLSHSVMREGRQSGKVRHAILFTRPDRLRVETLPAGSAFSLNLLAVEHGEAVFLDPGSKRAYKGRVDAELLRDVVGIQADLSELMLFLCGIVPVDDSGAAGGWTAYQTPGAASLMLVQGESRYFVLNAQSLELDRAHVRDPFTDTLRFEIGYSDYQESGGERLPRRIEVGIPDRKIAVELRFDKISLNGAISEKLYQVQIPPDYAVTTR
jgi:hypothetical protein